MALPRSKYVQDGQEGVYHCFSRCVRRAFLYGFDAPTGRDFSHRKVWLVDRLKHLAAIFAIEVCAYAIMENHYHSILRTRPDIVATWSDQEVATRWLKLFPPKDLTSIQERIQALADCPERIAKLRRRLCSLSWFMGRLNEFLARAANKEDKVKGRFWESRFKCQVLLDDAAIAACMVYVDLNPIRSALAATPEESDFTSIQERIRAWRKEPLTTACVPRQATHDIGSGSLGMKNTGEPPTTGPELSAAMSDALPDLSAGWLCPISSESQLRSILQMTAEEYFDLVDKSGRMIRSDKRGAIDADLEPILLRIGAIPKAWIDSISRFGSDFRLAAGRLPNLYDFANRIGRRWIKGIATARASFAASPPRPA